MPFGELDVYVEGAVGIKDTALIGLGSPYCTLTCGNQVSSTPVIPEGGSHPCFDTSFHFYIDRTANELQLTLLSRNSMSDDDILGYTTISFKEAFFHGHEVPVTPYNVLRPSGRAEGQIRLSLKFHSRPRPPGYQEIYNQPPEQVPALPNNQNAIRRQPSVPDTYPAQQAQYARSPQRTANGATQHATAGRGRHPAHPPQYGRPRPHHRQNLPPQNGQHPPQYGTPRHPHLKHHPQNRPHPAQYGAAPDYQPPIQKGYAPPHNHGYQHYEQPPPTADHGGNMAGEILKAAAPILKSVGSSLLKDLVGDIAKDIGNDINSSW